MLLIGATSPPRCGQSVELRWLCSKGEVAGDAPALMVILQEVPAGTFWDVSPVENDIFYGNTWEYMGISSNIFHSSIWEVLLHI